MPGGLLPDDDLYARLEVDVNASPEAIEVAWRALLKRHHPDVAGERRRRARPGEADQRRPRLAERSRRSAPATTRSALGLAPVTTQPARERPGARGFSPRGTRATATAAARARRSSTRVDLVRGDPAERLARFLARVEHLTPDELDRLAAAEPPPIAFLATVRRFLGAGRARPRSPTRRPSSSAACRPTDGPRSGCAKGCSASPRSSCWRRSSTTCWPSRSAGARATACCGPGTRAGPAAVRAQRRGRRSRSATGSRRSPTTSSPRSCARRRASTGPTGRGRTALDRDEDEALRISALLAERDVAAAVPVAGSRRRRRRACRRLAARLGHVTALRHAFPAPVYAGARGAVGRRDRVAQHEPRQPGRTSAGRADAGASRSGHRRGVAIGVRVCDPRLVDPLVAIPIAGLALALLAALVVMRRRGDEVDALRARLHDRDEPPAGIPPDDPLLDLLPVGLLVFDSTGRVARANDRAYGLLGTPAGRLPGRSLMETFLDARIERLLGELREGAAVSTDLRTGDGEPRQLVAAGDAARRRRARRRARGRDRAAPAPADPHRVHRQPEPRAADAAVDGQPARRDARARRRARRRPRADARADREDRGRDGPPRPDGQRAAGPRPDRGRQPAPARATTWTSGGSRTRRRSGSGCSPSGRASRSRWTSSPACPRSAATRPGSGRCSSTSSTTRSSSARRAARSGSRCGGTGTTPSRR